MENLSCRMNPAMSDLSLPYCVYETRHPSGFYYRGKGLTAKVVSGAYQGSGVRFKLALTLLPFNKSTWSSIVLATFISEDEAFIYESELVTLESLADPYSLNMHVGGAFGKYQTHGKLLQKIGRDLRADKRCLKKIRDKARKDKDKATIKKLNKQLKDKK